MRVNQSFHLQIDYSIENSKWKLYIDKRKIHKIIKYIIQEFDLKQYASHIELSILLTDEVAIQQINKEYRHIDKSTNVIALAINNFLKDTQKSIYGNILALGDIAMSFENVFREAEEQYKTFQNHFIHLLVHALLHLIGYDHQNDTEAEIMEKLEIDILKKFDISTPYA